MNNLKDILKDYNFKIKSLKYIGKVVIIDTDKGKYIYKNKNNQAIYEYLNSRGFNYYPKPINNKNTSYELVEFIQEEDISNVQKIYDLTNITAYLHKKTAFDKEMDLDDIKTMYEKIENDANYLMSYYNDLNNIIDNIVFMSPRDYLLVRNINLFYYLISFVKVEIANWYNNIKDSKVMRYSMIHNNLDISHLLVNNSTYLISWDKAEIGLPYKDIKRILENNYYDLDFVNFMNNYNKINKLDSNEYLFLLINLAIPKRIEFTNNMYLDCYNLSNYLEYLRKIVVLAQKYDKIKQKI